VDWIHLAQDKEQWLALVCMLMNLWASQKTGNFLTSCVTIKGMRKEDFGGKARRKETTRKIKL
jgi:hypothetical protein